MSIGFEINAQPRNDGGKGANRRLRHAGRVPGIIYGAEQGPTMISVAHHELVQHLDNEAFYSHILTVDVAGKKDRVVLKDLQRHPSKPLLLHLDLQRISESSKVRVHVPLHFVGENVSPGAKQGGSISHNVIDVEISCLPKDLPEFLEVDLSTMNVGDTLHLSELMLPQGVEIPALASGPEQDLTVVSVHGAPRGISEEEGEEAEEAGPTSTAEE